MQSFWSSSKCEANCNHRPSSPAEVVASTYPVSKKVISKQYENVSAIQSHAGMKVIDSVNKISIRLHLKQC